jgi:hypothetical protein
MDLIFFKTDEEFTQAIGGKSNITLDQVRSKVFMIQETILFPAISRSFGEAFLLKYNNFFDELEERELKALSFLQKSLAHLTMAFAASDLDVMASAGGFLVSDGERGNIASGKRVAMYQESRFFDGQRMLDSLVDYLELNRNENYFLLYKESTERGVNRIYFVPTADVANSKSVLRVGRFVFDKMLALMGTVEAESILPVIGSELFQDLKNRSVNGSSWEVYEPLKNYIQTAVVNLLLARSLDFLKLKVDSQNGVYIPFFKNANEPQQSMPAAALDLTRPIELCTKNGMNAIAELKNELLTNSANYPLYTPPNTTNTPTDKPANGFSFCIG